MQNENISDIIEAYLKDLLETQAAVDIRRAEIARQFNCVPSQINYVIKTRFTPARGYVIESKRGGGGYIRIARVKLNDDQDLIDLILKELPEELRFRDARDLVQELFDHDLVGKRAANLMLAALSPETLGILDRQAADRMRARLFLAFLSSLRYER